MSTALPEWMYPPRESGWEAGDLDLLPPEAPSHVELLDGALILHTTPLPLWHNRVTRRLTDALEEVAPHGWTVAARMTVTLGRRSRPEPDVVVASVPYAPERTGVGRGLGGGAQQRLGAGQEDVPGPMSRLPCGVRSSRRAPSCCS